ncbi:MAG TPA: hypothetical protein VNH84_16295 [Candidatus Saccharimonadales bacterium]|nr:hypothetical protein [Candidatus Saccharimonadales bacterium]
MSKLAFFRQSGWMAIATTVNGALMALMHKAAKGIPEYGAFFTLLSALGQMAIPAVGLQLAFAHLTASRTECGREMEIKGALRSLLIGSFGFWLVAGLIVLPFEHHLLATWKIASPWALRVTLLVGLFSLWQPLLLGLLQGEQNFLWFGWAAMSNGLVRLVTVAILTLALGGQATGAMIGVLFGMVISMGIAAWPIRKLWRVPAAPFAWLPWLKKALPITLSLGAVTVMLTQDMLVVQAFFPETETAYYAAAGLIGRTLYYLIAPITYVLFPKVVQSAAKAEKTSVLVLALVATGLLGGMAALLCTLFPELPLLIIYDRSYLRVAPLVPLYAWCTLPLALSALLVNNLLARERFGVVWWLVASAAGYWVTLRYLHQSFTQVIQVLGFFGTILFVGCALLTWWEAHRRPASGYQEDGTASETSGRG